MTSIYLRLAGPLQSWAGPKVSGNVSRTQRYPRRSALIGLIAAALGFERGQLPAWLDNLTFDVREDNLGRLIDEFQIIGSRPESWDFSRRLYVLLERRQAPKKDLLFSPDSQHGNAIARRTYLSNAEFIVRIFVNEHAEEIDTALAAPKFVTYLGRKAFAPSFPFYLGIGSDNELSDIPTFQHEYTSEQVQLTVRRLFPLGMETTSVVKVPATSNRLEWLEQVGKSLRRRGS